MTRAVVTFYPRLGPPAVVPCELAADEPARVRGLTGRALPPGAGLLLWFDAPTDARITTRATVEPLDVVFLDDAGEVVAIAHDAAPGAPTLLRGPRPSRAVVELAGGAAAHMGLYPGDRARVVFR